MSEKETPPARAYVNAYLDQDREVVALWRDERGVLREERMRAEWVAYLREADVPRELARKLSTSPRVRGVKREGEWIRVSFTSRWERREVCSSPDSPLVREGVTAYEADVDPIRRWLSDSGVHVARARRAYVDFETDSRCTPLQAKQGKARVLCWTIVDRDTGVARCDTLAEETDADERALLERFWAALAAYDQVVAWGGDDFDFPVVWKRSERLDISVDARRWSWLDELAAYEKMNKNAAESGDEKRSMKLQAIATAELGEGKDDFDASKTYEAWRAGGAERRRLVAYNVKDTVLLKRIEDKTGYLALFETICEVCRLFPETSSLQPTRQMDGFLLRLGVERGHHFASKRYRSDQVEDDDPKYKGAFVLHPKEKGILRNVHVADFSGMYPSIIVTFNMSPDTKVAAAVNGPIAPGTCRSPSTGVSFRTDVAGILVQAVRELLRLRKHWTDVAATLPPGTPEQREAKRRSDAYKVAVNSFYGVVGSPFSRYYDSTVAESITQTGVWLINMTIHAAEQRGWTVIYGDTDSIFVRGCTTEEFAEFSKWCNAELYPPAIQKQGCVENIVKLGYEKAFDRLVFTTAKRYVASMLHYKGTPATKDSRPEIKGIEYKRGDTVRLAHALQAEVIDMLVGGLKITSTPCTEQIENYCEVVTRARAHILEAALTLEEIVRSQALSKPLSQYVAKEKKDGTPGTENAHVRVARVLEQRGQPTAEGQKIEYVVVDGASSPQKVIPAADYTGSEVDRFYLWESLVWPPTQRLLEGAFPSAEWASWGRVRPPKPRGRRGTPPLAGQASLFEKGAA